jgi:uncharacterized membrane protein YdjX (TVP38/TMEM64 family)
MYKKELLANALWLVLILALIYVSVSYLGINDLRERIDALGAWGPITLIAAKASTLVFAPLGGAPLLPAAGALFGTWYGFVYVMLGQAIGSTICFFIGRRFGGKVVRRFVTNAGMPVVERVLGHMGTTRGFIETRFFFIGFPEAVSYAAGMTKLPFLKFITIDVLMHAGPVLAFVWAGDAFITLNPLYAFLYMGVIALLVVGGGTILWRRAQALSLESDSMRSPTNERDGNHT